MKKQGWRNGKKYALPGLFLFGFWLTTTAQPLTRDQLTGQWIGVHAELNNASLCPLSTYLDLRSDGSFYLGMVDGKAPPKVMTWAMKAGQLRLDVLTYALDLISLTNDVLRIGQDSPMLFRRFQEIAVDSTAAFQTLNGRVWETDSLRLSLFANGKLLWENCQTYEQTVHCWQLARYGTAVFLVTRGNAHTCEGDYKPLWQLTQSGKQQFRAIGWNGQAVATETFRLVRPLKLSEMPPANEFQRCANCFDGSRYSVAEPFLRRYQPMLYDIRKAFEQYYKPVVASGQSGLVQIQFAVDCDGRMGRFLVKGFDNDYQAKSFDPQLVAQLLTICRQKLPAGWRRDPLTDQQQSDIDVLLNVRLSNGTITDVFL
ncbi:MULTISPECIES: hypothetical protein [Spirosoma]|uniref:Uncharacterized protein n=1 Tax=Spirosoma sordidisoli TaxID=2502893 RepID=A0A4V1RVZ8_9BACT|nr:MULTISPECIES: hypothetical protein [Spirosoma]RYC68518.1 hypothetical protein EQG79_19395 [Spirosoma sordidisoli]